MLSKERERGELEKEPVNMWRGKRAINLHCLVDALFPSSEGSGNLKMVTQIRDYHHAGERKMGG